MASFTFRVLCSVAIDGSLALLCGLMLTHHWLRASAARHWTFPLAPPAAVLVIAQTLQLVSTTAEFTGQTSLLTVCDAVPDMFNTHAGRVMMYASAMALLLLVCTVVAGFHARTLEIFRYVATIFLIACLTVRAGVGHAATETLFSFSQVLQCVHLVAMSVWSGGILVAGVLVAPRLASNVAPELDFPRYLAVLSRACTIAVVLVLLTGVTKSFVAVSGEPGWKLWSPWGLVLAAKVVCVLAALGLGVANRLRLRPDYVWSQVAIRSSTKLLRLEATAMAAVLILSATLGNLHL